MSSTDAQLLGGSNGIFFKRCLATGLMLSVSAAAALSAAERSSKSGEPKPLGPLPAAVAAPQENLTTTPKVALGKQLFFDPRLSGDNTISCATCHLPEKAFADGLPRGKGKGGKQLGRNTPTVLNTAFYTSYFWDGRASSLERQALGPIQSPEEMDQDLSQLEDELNAVAGYVQQFHKVFGGPVNREGIAKALAAFQRTLVTGRSPLDRYLEGDESALSDEAQRGLELFVGEAGCIRCHEGPLLSDQKFHRLGISYKDPGRGKVTGKRQDLYRFRTPSLRNVAQTGPYMHDGSLATLNDVVMFYFRGVSAQGVNGLPLDIEPLVGQSFSDITDLVAFLESLSGEPPLITPPKLPD